MAITQRPALADVDAALYRAGDIRAAADALRRYADRLLVELRARHLAVGEALRRLDRLAYRRVPNARVPCAGPAGLRAHLPPTETEQLAGDVTRLEIEAAWLELTLLADGGIDAPDQVGVTALPGSEMLPVPQPPAERWSRYPLGA